MSHCEMIAKYGESKHMLWIDSGKLRWTPDPLTGSEETLRREYEVPLKWTREHEGREGRTEIFTETETKAEDYTNLRSLCDKGEAASETAGPTAIVKKGPGFDHDTAMQQRVDEFLASPKLGFGKVQKKWSSRRRSSWPGQSPTVTLASSRKMLANID